MRLKPLPIPDVLEVGLAPDYRALIVSDETPLAMNIVQALQGRGWPTLVVSSDPEELKQKLKVVAADSILIGAFVGIHTAGNAASEENFLSAVFAAARVVGASLKAASSGGRAWFVTVTQLDGALGWGETSGTRGEHAAGVAGLTKSLRREWPEVFCRAVDLDPSSSVEALVAAVVGELWDPDLSIAEVAHGSWGRVTPTTELG